LGEEEGVVFHTGVVSDPADFDKATVEVLDTGAGEVIMITIPEGVDGKEVEPVAVDEIGDLADDQAKDMVDDLANNEHLVIDEPVIEVLPAPEPAPVEKPKLSVCGPHTLGDQWYDFSGLGTEAEEGYYSRVFDETDGEQAEGWLQWNYCKPFEAGRFARYYRRNEYDVTIADTDIIENLSVVDGGVRFEMETSTVCDTNKAGEDYKFKFVTHLSCGDKTGPLDWEKDLDKVWYREHCEYHVQFSHAAGCGNDIVPY
jgi:hypothetical protein